MSVTDHFISQRNIAQRGDDITVALAELRNVDFK